MMYCMLGIFVISTISALASYLRETFKPSITLDDVRRLIEENNALLEKKLEKKFQM